MYSFIQETNALTTLQNSIIAVESKIKSLSQDMTSIADENRNYEKKLNVSYTYEFLCL